MDGAIKTEHWYNIENVDVMADSASGTLITFGDSISDGHGATPGHNDRWPDNLALRLSTNTPTSRIGVVNTGMDVANKIEMGDKIISVGIQEK